ncbi:hypothetical protein U14_02327 [Candidatus Moduliflexus flocculans]|uniref:Uncharacterized protein n=1 Tax=Candidatus Moduliflexus flocculans TaxID=1499966 RepID=A0A0S6VU64_9BACT|nr:hypothetical protein U14_02327 [Candidatus Moduliflexus flocculans]
MLALTLLFYPIRKDGFIVSLFTRIHVVFCEAHNQRRFNRQMRFSGMSCQIACHWHGLACNFREAAE